MYSVRIKKKLISSKLFSKYMYIKIDNFLHVIYLKIMTHFISRKLLLLLLYARVCACKVCPDQYFSAITQFPNKNF